MQCFPIQLQRCISRESLSFPAGCRPPRFRVLSVAPEPEPTRQEVPLHPGPVPERGDPLSREQPVRAGVRPHVRGEDRGGRVSTN